MKILIVSGFLGAGKTTFIKELIRRSGTKPVVLENEYGENSIDARELGRAGTGGKKPEILEFMEGCVCCTMKDSFVNSVLTVFTGLSPEYLIVEPTGVGRFSNIINNLKPILHDNISLLKPVVVLSPGNYAANMREWSDLYKDQVAFAQKIIFSKCEREAPEIMEQTAAKIRAINPDAEIADVHYSRMSDEWWRDIMEVPAHETEAGEADNGADAFTQITINNGRLNNPAELILLLEDCMRGGLGHIARAKGTVPVGAETLRFDLADNLYAITGSEDDTSQCVFIGEALDKAAICERMGSSLERESLAFDLQPGLKGRRRGMYRRIGVTRKKAAESITKTE
jgi:G3E family GTPase